MTCEQIRQSILSLPFQIIGQTLHWSGKAKNEDKEILVLSSRKSGILLHPTSLPGKFGIGDLGPEAYKFVDWLENAGQKLWQILPLGPTGAGDSPYQPFSSFAGNEILISLELLAKNGYIDHKTLADFPRVQERAVDYGTAFHYKLPLLKNIASGFIKKSDPSARADYREFCVQEKLWLDDYALFMAIKRFYEKKALKENIEGAMWANYWPTALARRDAPALENFIAGHGDEIEEYRVLQYFFFSQWRDLKKYANDKNIEIIGDIPIFVSFDSADVWSNPELFQLDANMQPTAVAGVPPDYFSKDGQFWGNPLYNWAEHERTSFSWWVSRIKSALSLLDFVRIDHFRGFDSCWSVPAREKTARKGKWIKAPGKKFLEHLQRELGSSIPIIAEDLGFITREVRDLRDQFGLPGMKILQFAFDAHEAGSESPGENVFLPHNYPQNCIVYTGTHDNDTLPGWLSKASSQEISGIKSYLGYTPKNYCASLIREAFKSVAAFAVIPMQDVLGMGSDFRMNTPSTPSGNWCFRLIKNEATAASAAKLRQLSDLYGRNS